MDDFDPEETLGRIRAGDAAAWEELTGRYSNLLWSIARSLGMNEADAADVVQTSWLRLLEHLDGIRNPRRLGAWLATIVRHESLTIHRRAARLQVGAPDEPEGWDGVVAVADPLEDGLLRDERDAALWHALGLLRPTCQRLMRVLMADPPPSYAEIAAALDIPMGSIGPTRQRCFACLRELLDGDLFDESRPADTRKG
ncbi:RNA polymerase sigma factor [Dactylosporangium sp. CS-033363]|uniref:RNA polymerase sigma factor n=1 Tax=Dactylosporangium sp. CS-033363 TaxID=3239935 RepID=UPI003D8B3334